MAINILVVDDEEAIADLVEVYLKSENYNVLKCYNGKDALKCVEKEDIDLAILDVMLPDIDGFDICQKIRENHHFPVIMLTARDENIDKITGLTIGADDYITKPFQMLELVARVKAQLRRVTKYNQQDVKMNENVIIIGGLVVDKENHECTINDEPLSLTPTENSVGVKDNGSSLTPTEFSILWVLCKNRGKVVDSEKLFEEVWGEKYFVNSTNTIMVHIRHLRDKMNDSAENPKYIKTVWGVGYKIEG